MENKISTSIQYQYTNVKLFREIFYNFQEFNSYLGKGPEVMKEYFLKQWNELKEELKNNDKLLLKDLEKNVTKNDFDITFNETSNKTPVFFFTFPNYGYRDGTSKYVALVLAPNSPRFITLEYSENYLTKELCWVIGEFVIDEETKSVKHNNYGQVDNDRLSWFAGYVIGMLEKEGL